MARFGTVFRATALVLGGALVSGCNGSNGGDGGANPDTQPPNILFIIMDDVGIDQMRVFGYGGLTAPGTPNIDVIAEQGVMFRNTWAMPECSPSRAVFFSGRYPLRTNITDAIVSSDLANSQLSPYEYTIPRLLSDRGYDNAIFGKTHVSGSPLNPDLNPYGYTAPSQLGWQTFAGWSDGAPNPIDTTAGGVAPSGTYTCGYVPSVSGDATHGADTGACYTVDGACGVLSRSDAEPTPGRACLERGGILVPNAQCATTRPANVDFTRTNGYYVSELITNDKAGDHRVFAPEDRAGVGRTYRTRLESQLAIDWIRKRPANKPWMATLSFSASHAPYQAPPRALLPANAADTDGYDCVETEQVRTLNNQMIEALDGEVGRLLVDTGIATRNADGTLAFDPARTDTMVVIVGDNGSYTATVKAPFDPLHAKAYVNQTGVWVPLVVAGPLVVSPGREVGSMVNIADLYALFAEVAGVDLAKAVPSTRAVDAAPMLPYLTNPSQPSLRQTNWAQTGDNLRATTTRQGACVVPAANVCTTLFPQQGLCELEGGVWYGAGSTQSGVPTEGYDSCCDVQKAQIANGETPMGVLPTGQRAIRNDTHKLIQLEAPNYESATDACVVTSDLQFYRIDEGRPIPRIDFPELDLGTTNLAPDDQAAFDTLSAAMQQVMASSAPCPGDGNFDGVINGKDIDDFKRWRRLANGLSTWFDFNFDGLTDAADLATINDHRGEACSTQR